MQYAFFIRKYGTDVTKEKKVIIVKIEHIKNMLQLSCNFNTSSIYHSFEIGNEENILVKCIRGTFIIEVTSSEGQPAQYYTSIDKAAEALYEKINSPEKI